VIAAVAAWVLRTASGKMLDGVLGHLNKRTDAATAVAVEQIKAEVERRNAQRDVLLAGNRWLQWLFVVPLGVWFTAVIADSLFLFTWNVAALPHPLNDWAGWIISALFLVDAGPRIVGAIGRGK
jgi:hypothetical protein